VFIKPKKAFHIVGVGKMSLLPAALPGIFMWLKYIYKEEIW